MGKTANLRGLELIRGTYRDLDCEIFKKISTQSQIFPNDLVGDGRSMQNGTNITKCNKQNK